MNFAPLTRKIPTQMPEAVLKESVCRSRMLEGGGSSFGNSGTVVGGEAYERSLSHFSAFDCDDTRGTPTVRTGRERPTARRYELRNDFERTVSVRVDVHSEREDRSGACESCVRSRRGRGETRNIDIVGENKQQTSMTTDNTWLFGSRLAREADAECEGRRE